jgi:hypothetical protein
LNPEAPPAPRLAAVQAAPPNTRPGRWVIDDDPAPQKPSNPLKTNGSEKRQIHRQKSSFVVRTGLNPLISLNNQ